jgi:hypothetical protein
MRARVVVSENRDMGRAQRYAGLLDWGEAWILSRSGTGSAEEASSVCEPERAMRPIEDDVGAMRRRYHDSRNREHRI